MPKSAKCDRTAEIGGGRKQIRTRQLGPILRNIRLAHGSVFGVVLAKGPPAFAGLFANASALIGSNGLADRSGIGSGSRPSAGEPALAWGASVIVSACLSGYPQNGKSFDFMEAQVPAVSPSFLGTRQLSKQPLTGEIPGTIKHYGFSGRLHLHA